MRKGPAYYLPALLREVDGGILEARRVRGRCPDCGRTRQPCAHGGYFAGRATDGPAAKTGTAIGFPDVQHRHKVPVSRTAALRTRDDPFTPTVVADSHCVTPSVLRHDLWLELRSIE